MTKLDAMQQRTVVHRHRSRTDWIVGGSYIASVIVATELTSALDLRWYVLVGYLVAATTAIIGYYGLTR